MACYTSSSQLFLPGSVAQQENFILNGIAIAALGIGTLGQAMISTLCLVHSSRLIPTWSSNPLNTALVLLHKGAIKHRPGRCMLSVGSLTTATATPAVPYSRQPAMRTIKPSVRHVTRLLWALVLASSIWWAIVYALAWPTHHSPSSTTISLFLGRSTDESSPDLNLQALLVAIAFQACITLALHGAELLVNVSRDEDMWRRASANSSNSQHRSSTAAAGVRISYGRWGSIKFALCSWQTLVLFVMKPVTHWLFGLSLGMKNGVLIMDWQGILPLASALLLVVGFAMLLTRRKVKGAQPAAFGSLQTLVDLVDEWPGDVQTPMWWGDKGVTVTQNSDGDRGIGGKVRHAGTDTRKLHLIQLDCLYAGKEVLCDLQG